MAGGARCKLGSEIQLSSPLERIALSEIAVVGTGGTPAVRAEEGQISQP
jgi:hypothetical protein